MKIGIFTFLFIVSCNANAVDTLSAKGQKFLDAEGSLREIVAPLVGLQTDINFTSGVNSEERGRICFQIGTIYGRAVMSNALIDTLKFPSATKYSDVGIFMTYVIAAGEKMEHVCSNLSSPRYNSDFNDAKEELNMGINGLVNLLDKLNAENRR